MKNLTYTIKDELGIHARPAGLLVKLCIGFQSDVQIRKGDKTGNAKKIFSVMGLGVKCGEEVELTITGEDEEAAFDSLEKFMTENL